MLTHNPNIESHRHADVPDLADRYEWNEMLHGQIALIVLFIVAIVLRALA